MSCAVLKFLGGGSIFLLAKTVATVSRIHNFFSGGNFSTSLHMPSQTGNSYTRTPCYTDQNHIITTDYWETIIYPQCEEPRFMEHSINKLSPYDSKQFGTFVFGDFKTPKQIHHINCRRAKPILSKKN